MRASRALLLRCWTEATGRTWISPHELQAVLAVAPALRSEHEAAAVLGALYGSPDVASALEQGHLGQLAAALRRAGVAASQRDLAANAREVARQLGEPLCVALRREDGPPPAEVLTVEGWLSLEADYLPRVVTRELGGAHPEALRAQAIAARTYVLRAMRDDPELGRNNKPIPNSERFQTYAEEPTQAGVEATEATRGIVARYQGELIIANYVAGAVWTAEGIPAEDRFRTERFVTYNDSKTGSQVKPTPLSKVDRSDNRGCMSQNGASWLARHGRLHPEILRYFYGADLELTGSTSSSSPSTSSRSTPSAAPFVLAALAAAALAG